VGHYVGCTVALIGIPPHPLERNTQVMTYPVLMELASQREHQIAARARAARPEAVPATVTERRSERRTVRRGRTRVATRLRTLVSRA
jgi:hypothetical protein